MGISNLELVISILVGTITIVGAIIWIGRFIQRVNDHDNRLKDIAHDLDGIKQEMSAIRTLLMMKHKGVEGIFSQKHSPRTLNDMGKKLYSDMNGQAFLKDNKQMLFKAIDSMNPKTAYDVENAAYMACVSNAGTDAFNVIKTFLYNYPTMRREDGSQYEVSMDAACFVLSIPLRDMYIDEHPQIMK